MILLPATAKDSSKLGAVRVDLSMVDPKVLESTWKRIASNGRPTNQSVFKRRLHLEKVLSSPEAIWTLCYVMLPWNPEPKHEICRDTGHCNAKGLLAITARVIASCTNYTASGQPGTYSSHLMFKLTKETVQELKEYYEGIHLVNIASHYGITQSDQENAKKKYKQSVERYLFIPPIDVLEGLDCDGTGELLQSRSADVKNSLMELLHLPTLELVQASHTHLQQLPNDNFQLSVPDPPQFYQEYCASNSMLHSLSSTPMEQLHPDSWAYSTFLPQCLCATGYQTSTVPPQAAFSDVDLWSTTFASSNSTQMSTALQSTPWPSMIAAKRYIQRPEMSLIPSYYPTPMQVA